MKILIADSGSTKTDWCLIDNTDNTTQTAATQGINPFYQSDAEIENIIGTELVYALADAKGAEKVFFYGAGLRPEMIERMTVVLTNALSAQYVEAASDLLGAARALFQSEEGIACILGTGANSGLYDGCRITANTPPLGFILGDEGSGAVLGKLFLGTLCKGLMPEGLLEEYLEETQQSVADIINAVYRKPLPNRYLAQTAKFIHRHLDIPEVEEIVTDNFRQFFRRNLMQYHRNDLPVRAIGSIAAHFEKQFKKAAKLEGFAQDIITEQSPMQGLVKFHAEW